MPCIRIVRQEGVHVRLTKHDTILQFTFFTLHLPTDVTKANKTFTRLLNISNYHITIYMQSTTSNMSDKWTQYLVISVFWKSKIGFILFDICKKKDLQKTILNYLKVFDILNLRRE